MRERVIINDVGPRDGLQNQPKILSSAEKILLIESLLAAQISHIELGAFVSPKAVPAMAGTDQIVAAMIKTKLNFQCSYPIKKAMTWRWLRVAQPWLWSPMLRKVWRRRMYT